MTMNSESVDLKLGDYKVLRKKDGGLWRLGQGEYGTTYKAEDVHLGRVVALKVINENLIQKSDIKARFLQEARAVARLEHPNIANVYSCGESKDGICYFAMKYCAGGDLEQYSEKRGPLPWSEVKGLALQILNALKEAHSKGLLHRDLKPSNVMLENDEKPPKLRLIDFGLVKVLESNESDTQNISRTQEGAFMGNVLTASPEQLDNEDLDQRSDLFSLGITLWYLLCGKSPFDGVSRAKLVHLRYSTENYVSMFPKDLEPEGKYVLSKLLMKNKEDRFASAEEVIQAIESGECGDFSSDGESGDDVPPPPPSSCDFNQAIEPNSPSENWEDKWHIAGVIKQFSYGSYYACQAKVGGRDSDVSLFIPDESIDDYKQICEFADRLIGAETKFLNRFIQKGVIDGKAMYACCPFGSGNLQNLLHTVKYLTLQNHLSLFQQIALGVDESISVDIPGVELEVPEVLIRLREGDSPQDDDGWRVYFSKRGDQMQDCISLLEVTVLPKLNMAKGSDNIGATIGGDDLASNPIARFGGLLYRSISGMSVKQAAYMTSRAHVSSPHISEESNRYLSEVIAGCEVPESALAVLQHLCELEGVDWEMQIVQVTQVSKEQQSKSLSQSLSRMGQLSISSMGKSMSTSGVLSSSRSSMMESSISDTNKSTPFEDGAKSSSLSGNLSSSSHQTSDISQEVTNPREEINQSVQQSQISLPSRPQESVSELTIKPQKKSSKKKGLLIAGGVLLVSLVLIGGGYYTYTNTDIFHKNKRSKHRTYNKDSSSQQIIDHGDNELTSVVFPRVSMRGATLPKQATILIKNHQGDSVATIQIQDGHASSKDFPEKVFSDTSVWPMSIALDLDGYQMKNVILELNDFKQVDGVGREYKPSLILQPIPYLDFTPTISFRGNSIPTPEKWLKKYLTPYSTKVEWSIQNKEGRVRVCLLSNHHFPLKSLLAIPFFEEEIVKIGDSKQVKWNLTLLKRSVTMSGLGDFKEAVFEPDYSKIKDLALRKMLQKSKMSKKLLSKDVEDGCVVWEVPSLPGKVLVDSASGDWSFDLSLKTKFKVFTSDDKQSDVISSASDDFLKMKKQAEEGDVIAQRDLGIAYHDGNGVKRNFEASMLWLKMAADQGDQDAAVSLAVAYGAGDGVDQNPTLAYRMMKRLADQGNPDALCKLALYYRDGVGVKKDYEQAKVYLSQAVAKGNNDALFFLGELYETIAKQKTNKTEKSSLMVKATKLYQQAAEKGSPEAFYNLGINYYYGIGGLEKNEEKAKEYFRKVIQIGGEKIKNEARNALRLLGEKPE